MLLCSMSLGWLTNLSFPSFNIFAINGPPIPQTVILSIWSSEFRTLRPSPRRTSTS